jgi:8-amino-7-oxononanoate synthase
LAGLAEKHGAFLYLDEAHAMGVLGPGGLGLAAGLAMDQSLVMGTFSKGLGSYGGYVCCSETIREYLVNRSPGFIFSTALPPPVLGAVDAALDLLPDMDQARQDLQATAAWLRQSLGRAGLGTGTSSTQIVPVMIGQSDRALAASQALEEAGVLAVAVRPPTVPEGTSRLRLSLTAAHSRPAVEKAGEIIIQVLGSLA